MTDRFLKLGAVVFLAGAGLALVPAPVRAQATHDLDTYSYEALVRDLTDELETAGLDLDTEYSLDELKSAIMDALSQDFVDPAGDDESAITAADLEAEMAEAHTTLGQVVDAALARADELSIRRGSAAGTMVQIKWPLDSVSSECGRNERGCATPRAAYGQVAPATARTIKQH